MSSKGIRACNLALLVAAAALTSGCANALIPYRQPIATFRAAATDTATASSMYLVGMNRLERDAYIDAQADHSQGIDPARLTDLIFTPDGIALRIKALNALTSYVDLLNKLANSDAPDTIASDAKSLGDHMVSLGNTVEALNSDNNQRFKTAIGVLSPVVQAVARYATQQKVKKALEEAILKGQASVEGLTKALSEDLDIAFVQRRRITEKRITDALTAYNQPFVDSRPTPPDERLRRASDLKKALTSMETLAAASPAAALASMANAHAAVLIYAKSEKRPLDFAALSEEMNAFMERAKETAALVNWMRGH